MRKRRGYVLIAVLGLATVVTALGLSFLDSHGTAMPEAMNYYRSVRAQYLAESGVALAAHYLMYPPTGTPVKGYYTGASGVAVDASSDYANITVSRSDSWIPPQSDLNLYRIASTGVAHDPDGAVRGKRMVMADVLVTPMPTWQLPYGCIAKSTLTVPASVRVMGNIHSNGLLTGSGTCNGAVTACGTALWLGGGPPTSIKSLQPSVSLPTGTISKYGTYTFRGQTCSAYAFPKPAMSAAEAAAINAMDMSATNPGRIILTPSGDFELGDGVELNGTLLVNLDLLLNGTGIQVTAVEGFPSVVVGDDIMFLVNGVEAKFTGPFICAGEIDGMRMKSATFHVVGPFILTDEIKEATGAGTQITFEQNDSRSVMWNLETPSTPQPITYLAWNEG